MRLRAALTEVYRRALAEVRADRLVECAIRQEPILWNDQRVWVFGAGKASVPMARPLVRWAGSRLAGGLVVTKRGTREDLPGIQVIESSHPVPDASSLAAGRALLEAASQVRREDLVLFVLSGGASALVEALRPGVSLEDLVDLNRRMLADGLPIGEMNERRKRLSLTKAGGISRAFGESKQLCFVLSDVIGNDLQTIGSGPMYCPGVEHRIVGSVHTAVQACANVAQSLGLDCSVLPEPFIEPVQDCVRALTRALGEHPPGTLVIGYGEPTLEVLGSGTGGRCQHFAAMSALASSRRRMAVLAGSTDGTDGPTEAAGGVIDEGTIARVISNGLDPVALLRDCDSHRLLLATGDLLVTGPTGSNVNDLYLAICD